MPGARALQLAHIFAAAGTVSCCSWRICYSRHVFGPKAAVTYLCPGREHCSWHIFLLQLAQFLAAAGVFATAGMCLAQKPPSPICARGESTAAGTYFRCSWHVFGPMPSRICAQGMSPAAGTHSWRVFGSKAVTYLCPGLEHYRTSLCIQGACVLVDLTESGARESAERVLQRLPPTFELKAELVPGRQCPASLHAQRHASSRTWHAMFKASCSS